MRIFLVRTDAFIAVLTLLCIIYMVTAYTPVEYAGCFEDQIRSNHILRSQIDQTDINNATITGDVCMQLCKTTYGRRVRYAGTKAGFQCFCGKGLSRKVSPVDNIATNCNTPCLGRSDEICGGSNHISLYDMSRCAKNPCQNGGRCGNNDNVPQKYMCFCHHGYHGHDCEIDKTPQWKGHSHSPISYLARSTNLDFQSCVDFCGKLDKKSRLATIWGHHLQWFSQSGLLKKDRIYWVRRADMPPTDCYEMQNSHVTRATSCLKEHGCVCQMVIA